MGRTQIEKSDVWIIEALRRVDPGFTDFTMDGTNFDSVIPIGDAKSSS